MLALLGFTLPPAEVFAASVDANRLTYLDENDPFYPHVRFPKLTTPQWIGEPGVEAAVILSIDDMRETGRYETFLRPILERLKQIDGRAPVSIMANAVTLTNAQLQAWLKEGLSLEVHTLAHPCPCLAKGDFTAAVNTYHGCVELMNQIPGNKPVAFRMPCCDSMNSPSPRFYAEIFNRTNSAGQFLTIDSSVMCLLTTNDPALPRELVMDADGREKFRKYFPGETNATTRVSLKNFATTIEDYPYPYVIGNLCWEFPAMVPSDWEAFNVLGPTNATLLADWKSALDAVVLKQGVFSFIFHPHGWSSPQQFVEFIDYAVAKHGKKVKFLTFREAAERLDKNLLDGTPLRAADGSDNGARVFDVNNDGYMDVVIAGNDTEPRTRLWAPAQGAWRVLKFPFRLARPSRPERTRAVCFGVLMPDGMASVLTVSDFGDSHTQALSHFDGTNWQFRSEFFHQATANAPVLFASRLYGGRGHFLLRDLNRDGRSELIVNGAGHNSVHQWSETMQRWEKLPFALPASTSILNADGQDAGLRFVDVNGDGYDDVLFSNEDRFSLHLFVPKANPRLMWEVGWNDQVWSGKRGESDLNIPPIVRAGSNRNNGVWFKNGAMWIQNEDTAHLPDKVDRRTFRELLTADQPPPLSPEQSLAALRLRPGFKAEIVAAEPLVLDPIAFEWGADGRLWVVDMFDYPLGRVESGASQPTRSPHGEEILTPPQGGHYVPGGRIKVLEDTDGDGRYDKSTVFLDNVNFPTGLLPNQQHRVNGFDYGLDNWIYGANGDSGGLIRSELKPSFPMVNMRGHDFRFRPDTGDFETVAGGTQFGRHRDDWGNWFGNNNSAWVWHYHLPEQYVERNPHLAVKSTKQMLANYPESGRLFPASRTRQRFNDFHQFNHVTSANSPMPYRDDLFGPEFATSVFISDPVHNVVHREVLQPDGISFTSHRAAGETNSEFAASADPWFRPTMLKTGPDGALYIADMYRLVIEHPEWIPKWVQARLDLRAGSDQGRIYRVAPKGALRRKIPNLARLDTAGLVAALDSPNGWQRDTAQRLLVERQDKVAVEALKRLSVEATNPKVRLQALCTLDGLDQLAPELLKSAFRDPHPAVREQAVRLAEKFADTFDFEMRGASGSPQFSSLINDPDLRVRCQLAFTLGAPGWKSDRPGFLLSRLAMHDFEQPGMQTAILSSAPRYVDQMLAEVFSRDSGGAAPAALIEQLLSLAAALNQPKAIASALEAIAHSPASRNVAWRFNALAGLLDGLERRNKTLHQFASECGPEVQALAEDLEKLLPIARKAAADEGTRESERLAAIRLLARSPERREEDFQRLGGLLAARYSSAIQRAALAELARQKERPAADALLAGWNGHSPALRTDALNVLLGRPDWCRALLAAIQKGEVPAGQIGAAFQEKLLNHPDRTVRQRAADLFTSTSTDRRALLKQYSGVEKLTGDVAKGMTLFRQQCATCHKLRGEGSDVGPDLATLAGKDVQTLLVAILDPNQTVEVRYVNYTAVTKSEREVSGILTAETANSITLRAPGGHEETLLRSDLNQLTSSGLSLMPDGLEKALTPQDMADLLAALLGK